MDVCSAYIRCNDQLHNRYTCEIDSIVLYFLSGIRRAEVELLTHNLPI